MFNSHKHTARTVLVCSALTFAALLCGLAQWRVPKPAAAAPMFNIITVTTTADETVVNGNCTLREAILAANTNAAVDGCAAGAAGTDTIAFNIAGSGVQTIALQGDLIITEPVVIDGYTQPGASPNTQAGCGNDAVLLIRLTNGASVARGLWLTSSNNTVRGLIISNFLTDGIRIETGGGNTIAGNFIGTDPTGMSAEGNYSAITLFNTTGNNTIGGPNPADRNVISGNRSYGIYGFNGNVGVLNVLNNFIGTNKLGAAAVSNSHSDIRLETAANIVALIKDNVIAGTASAKIRADSGSAGQFTVLGNKIGTNCAGTAGLSSPTAADGILSSNNHNRVVNWTIGGPNAQDRNLISGNHIGIGLAYNGTGAHNVIQGNYIGTDVTGAIGIPNGNYGIGLSNLASNTGTFLIGGTTPGTGNLISGNGFSGLFGFGIIVQGDGLSGTIQGNYIGTQQNGVSALPNQSHGIKIAENPHDILIGGTTAGAGNIIAFNSYGIIIDNGTGHRISGNSIHSNNNLGIDLNNDNVNPNDVGDADTGANNLQNHPLITAATTTNIQGTLNSTANTAFTLQFFHNAACDSTGSGEGKTYLGQTTVTTDGSGNVAFNFAGSVPNGGVVTATATDPQGNTSEFSGCQAVVSAINCPGATITVTGSADGTLTALAGNGTCDLREAITAANTNAAVGECPAGVAGLDTIYFALGAGTPTINVTGAPLPAITQSVVIDGSQCQSTRVELNGAGAGAEVNGLFIYDADNCIIRSLVINRFNGVPVIVSSGGMQGNGIKVLASSGTIIENCFIGTNAAGDAALPNGSNGIFGFLTDHSDIRNNLLSGNGRDGVYFHAESSGCQFNNVRGNKVGTNQAGSAAVPNALYGIEQVSCTHGIIGGTTAADRNLVSGNINNGIAVSSFHQVLGNYIGVDSTGTASLGNGAYGVYLGEDNIVGGTAPGERNIISGNIAGGIAILDNHRNQLLGNYIGTDVTGTVDLGNERAGVYIRTGNANIIGGTTSAARNIISGNTQYGILSIGDTNNGHGNRILGNYIGPNANGTSVFSSEIGVQIVGGNNNSLGEATAGAGNVISGHTQYGVYMANQINNNRIQGNIVGANPAGIFQAGFGNARGVYIGGNGARNYIGGLAAGEGNLIAYSSLYGVQVEANGLLISILGNSIFENGGMGIDLRPDGVTANDAGDADTGANNLQNFPVITQATTTNIQGTLNSTANTTFTLQFFHNPACDSTGNGEGMTYVGQTTVTTDGSGNVAFNFVGSVPGGGIVTATATDPQGNTSEFSGCQMVLSCPPPTLGTYPNTAVTPGGNTTVTPNTVPSGSIMSITASASGFTGTLSVNPVSGVVTISNAGPAGSYTVTVTATDNCGATTTTTFSLFVNCPGATITVTGTADGTLASLASNGTCDLREAITAANTNAAVGECPAGVAGLDTIYFAIGAGTPTISVVGSALPTITQPIVIDGSACQATRVELNGVGAGASADGLSITAGGSVVRSLVINRFSNNGILMQTNGGNRVSNCYIGIDVSGTIARGNGNYGIYLDHSPNNIIGGLNAGARNVVSANSYGIVLLEPTSSGNSIQGNYIGTDATGTADLGNTNDGVNLFSAPNNIIGGDVAGAGNLISGSNGFGIWMQNTSSHHNRVQGNLIGTNFSGTAALGNSHGIGLKNAPNNTIGGTTASARNIVAGYTGSGSGILIIEADAKNNLIQGNYIGTDITGTFDLTTGTFTNGIAIASAPDNTIGGTVAGARNLISGSHFSNLQISGGSASGNLVQGNYIGTNASGNALLLNYGTRPEGIYIVSAPNNIIGGTANGAGNLISGNQNGVRVQIGPGTTIQGNYIGTDISGAAALGNSAAGVLISSSTNVIVGSVSGAGNVIAFNGGEGVFVSSGVGNSIFSNSIFSNVLLGIDLSPKPVTANDAGDGDAGPNNLQNFPVLTQATATPNQIQGTLNSTANTAFTIQFFSNPACDGSGNGEGQTYLGQLTNVTTDGGGNAAFNFTPVAALTVGAVVTATATDPNGNTSEFSVCRSVTAAPPPTLSINDATVTEGNGGTVNAVFTVTLLNASSLPVTVQYATANATATAGSDYTATSGTLTFNTPPLTRTISVQVKGDTTIEPNETFFINLSNPTNATITDNQGLGTITNDDDCPSVTLLKAWGSLGAGNGQFNVPTDVAVDAAGNVYVADINNYRIQKFDANGNFLLKWGSYGSSDGQFVPDGVEVDATGNVYVADRICRIQKFSGNGNFLFKWGSYGSGNGQLNSPEDVAVDASGNVYVADLFNNRIQKFDANGNFLLKWGSLGVSNGQLNYPEDVAVDTAGNVYVADANNNRIQKFNVNGNFLFKWGSYGTGNGQFALPSSVVVDTVGNVYIADRGNRRIQKFDANGNFLLKWGDSGLFGFLGGLAVDAAGNVYTTDYATNIIQKFSVPPSPTANAGPDQTLTTAGGPIPVTLNGSGSSPFGSPLTYQWRKGATVLGSGASLSVNLPAGTHTITLVVTDLCGFPGYDTVVIKIGKSIFTGSDVTAQVDKVTTTFANVALAGAVFVETIEPSLAGAGSNQPTQPTTPNATNVLPNGYEVFDNLAYDVSTTATVSGPITVCFNVPTATNQAVFDSLRILHNESGALIDRTILAPNSPPPDFKTQTVCARTNALGQFVIARLLNNPPTISKAAANPSFLPQPNHSMVDVAVNYDTTAFWPPSTCLLSVTSSEPDAGLDANDLPNDIEIVNPHLVRLRAEQFNIGLGRQYSINISCTDNIAQTVSQFVTVTVNSPPILSYATPQTAIAGQPGTINPVAGPSDFNGSVASIVVQSVTPSLGAALTVNNSTGVVKIGNNAPIGSYAVTIRATDNDGATTDASFTLIVSGGGATSLQFYPLAHPVRLLDTRANATACDAPGAMITGQTSRTQTAAGRTCDGLTIPADAKALTGNITTVESGGGFLTLYPSDTQRPLVANSNFAPNQVLNNVFTVGLGAGDGAFNIFVTKNTNVVVDITGYYAPPSPGGLYFHPLPKPIRLLETRAGFGGCFTPGAQLQAGSTTSQLGQTTCDGVMIPAGAQALVGNATAVGPQSGGFLTLFPADALQPLAASSNFQTGINMNAPFTVGLSPSGEFNIFTNATTDLVIDVLGYYSTQLNDTNGQGLLFNSLPAPVRLLDTRANQAGCVTPGAQMTGGATYLQAATGVCTNIPAAALAVVGNATTVNASANGFLTFWPSSALQPTVAASNFRTGQAFNRHFTVGLGLDGAFNRFSSSTTDLVIDVSGYFAP